MIKALKCPKDLYNNMYGMEKITKRAAIKGNKVRCKEIMYMQNLVGKHFYIIFSAAKRHIIKL